MILNLKGEHAYPRYELTVFPENNTIFEGQGIRFHIVPTLTEGDGSAGYLGQPEWIDQALKDFLDAMVAGDVMGNGTLYKFTEQGALLKTATDQE